MEVFESKRVNPISNIIGVNSLRFGGLHIGLSSFGGSEPKLVNSDYIKYGVSPFRLDDILLNVKWRHPSLSELTPMLFNTGLTHLGLEASKYSLC